jgi:hypothetical protein
VGAAGPAQRTSNIAPVIQEIVNQPGWTRDNDLILILTGAGQRVAQSYNGSPTGATADRGLYHWRDNTVTAADLGLALIMLQQLRQNFGAGTIDILRKVDFNPGQAGDVFISEMLGLGEQNVT